MHMETIKNQEELRKVREILERQNEIITGPGTDLEKADALDALIKKAEVDEIGDNQVVGRMKDQRDQLRGKDPLVDDLS